MVVIQDADTGEYINWTTGKARSRGVSKTSLTSRAKRAAKGWWDGLGSEKQAELVGTAITVGVPLIYAGGKYVYNKIKEWRAKRKSKPTVPVSRPTNQTYQGIQTINYSTGGGGLDPINYDNYGDSASGSYGAGGESGFVNPIIL